MPGTTPGRKTFCFFIVYLTGSTPLDKFETIRFLIYLQIVWMIRDQFDMTAFRAYVT